MKHPELMVIGDSLAQGCRSLSVTRDLCAESYGARIAQSLGWDFQTPQHPRPIIFDLEKEIRRLNPIAGAALYLSDFDRISDRFKANISEWAKAFSNSAPQSNHSTFDNLGVAGFTVEDLMHRTARKSKDDVLQTIEENDLFNLPPIEFLKHIADLHLPLNAGYTLNPSNKEEYDSLSALDWARKREPKRLIVQILHNNETPDGISLYGVGGEARHTLFSYEDFSESLDPLAQELAALPDTIEEIYYFLLPKISGVANLKPTGRFYGHYSESYRPMLSTSPDRLSGDELRQIDDSIENLNLEIRRHFKTHFDKAKPNNSKRLKFVDAFELFDSYDYKNTGDKKRIIRIGRRKLDNEPLNGRPIFTGPPSKRTRRGFRLVDGGFQSVDGMHPSGVGYAIIAARLMEQMGYESNERELLQAAYESETLLHQFPENVELVYTALALAQKIGAQNGSVAPLSPDSSEDAISADRLIAEAQRCITKPRRKR